MAIINGTSGNDILVGGAENDTINGLAGNDQISGNGGNDTIDGGAGNDIITGGAGSDVLTGGTGADTFSDTAAGLNGDTITDFLPGDRIQITDLSKANANISLTGDTLSYTGGSLTIDGVGPGRFVIRSINTNSVEVRLQENAHNDFNGDGLSDLLWRDDSGQLTNWLANPDGSFTANGTNSYANVSLDWHIIGTGDFNGDGREDILWRNDNGLLTNWLANDQGGWSTNNAATIDVPTDWTVVGVADFNGDGHSDILWRQDTGQLTEWTGTGSGTFTDNSANATQFVAPNWKVIATGDFNGDGYQDILWREDGGQLTDWLGGPDGGFTQNSPNFSEFVATNWQVIATGDFNGDGLTDMLWRDSNTGQMTDWLATPTGGFTQNSSNFSEHVALNWQVVGVGDFNGDATDDILWRDSDTGQMTDWLGTTAGGFTQNSTHFSEAVATNWHIQDPFM